jgi:hypothetical protein
MLDVLYSYRLLYRTELEQTNKQIKKTNEQVIIKDRVDAFKDILNLVKLRITLLIYYHKRMVYKY